MARREKKVTIEVKNNHLGPKPHYEAHFDGPFGKGYAVINAAPPGPDTDILRHLVEYQKTTGKPSMKLHDTLRYLRENHVHCVIRGREWSASVIAPALNGQPDPADDPLPDVKPVLRTWKDAQYAGFAQFNGGPHLCVDVPDGNFTITCKTSEGREITFAFVPYKENGPPQCVDVQHHTSGVVMPNGDDDCPVQEVIAFTVGRDLFRSKLTGEKGKGCTLLTVLLKGKDGEDK